MKIAVKGLGDFEPVPAGNHVAICNAVVDLGMQPGSGTFPNPKPGLWLRFELPTERLKYSKDGVDVEGPMSIHRMFTASMNEKANLRLFIESWFGKKFANDAAASDFDVEKLLGKKCLLNVTHVDRGGRTYGNVVNATPIPKGMSAEYPQHNLSLYFAIEQWDDSAFNALPEWVRTKITNRIQVTPRIPMDKAITQPDFDDDIPF